ncbi:hypothetical protein BDW62DRAFT_216761 [Aspergillus aurantiobrunneus]
MSFTVGVAGIAGKFTRLVLKQLCSSDVQIRGFCRSASKLPAKYRDSARVTIVQGSSDDLEALRGFVRGCDVVICAYLGDNTLMTDGQKLLVDAGELEKLEYGQHPAKDPIKHGVHVLIGAFMETFWSGYFGIWRPDEYKLSFYGNGDEIWESTTYQTAAEYVAAVARDPSATGLQHFLGDRRSIRQIADDFAQVYGKAPQLERLGSLDDLYSKMQATFNKVPSNIFAYIAMFYQNYCTNGQTYLKPDLDNRKYPDVTPITFKKFLESHRLEDLSDAYQNAGGDA